MFEKFETIKHAEKPGWWIWKGTRVAIFGCHPNFINEFIQTQTNLYAEQGYEILDSFAEKGSVFARVRLLIRPKRVEEKEKSKIKNEYN